SALGGVASSPAVYASLVQRPCEGGGATSVVKVVEYGTGQRSPGPGAAAPAGSKRFTAVARTPTEELVPKSCRTRSTPKLVSGSTRSRVGMAPGTRATDASWPPGPPPRSPTPSPPPPHPPPSPHPSHP